LFMSGWMRLGMAVALAAGLSCWSRGEESLTAVSSDEAMGSVEVEVGTAEQSGDFKVSATAAEGYAFTRWEGDVPLTYAFDNPLKLRANRSRAVTAVFKKALYASPDGTAEAAGTREDPVSIEEAFARANAEESEYGAVVLLDGTYEAFSGEVSVGAWTLMSESGDPTKVILTSAGYNPSKTSLATTSRDGAIVGVTIQKGVRALGGIVANCICTQGTSGYMIGGGVHSVNGAVLKCTLTGNNSAYEFNGNALYQSGANAFADSCVITNNTGFYRGAEGNLYLQGGTVRNCLISANSGGVSAGGIRVLGVAMTGGTLENCTIVKNTFVDTFHAGLRATGGTVRNCIVADNSPGVNLELSDAVVQESVSTDGTLNYDGTYPAPTAASEAFDAGVAAEWMDEAYDLAGNRRVCGTVDAGCIEMQYEGDGLADFSINGSYSTVSLCRGTTVQLSGETTLGTKVASFAWYLNGSDTPAFEGATVSFEVPDQDGTLEIRLVASVDERQCEVAKSFTLVKKIYLTPSNANAAEPYDTPETAATNLSEAVAFAQPGQNIVVLDGTYTAGANGLVATVSKAITIESASGDYSKVVFDFERTTSGRLVLDNKFAVLRGICLKNAYTPGALLSNGALVEKCRITACVYNWSKGVSPVVNNGGIFRDCLFDSSWYENYFYGGQGTCEGLAYSQSGVGAMADRCIFRGNTFNDTTQLKGMVNLAGGVLQNCLVAENTSNRTHWKAGASARTDSCCGIYATGGEIRNCTIVSNAVINTNLELEMDEPGLRIASAATVVNTLIADNAIVTNVSQEVTAADSATITYSCTKDANLYGEGCVEVTPEAYHLADGIVSISLGGPCHNKGLAMAWMEGATDLYGKKRISGNRPDIGCAELSLTGLILFFQYPLPILRSDCACGGPENCGILPRIGTGQPPPPRLASLAAEVGLGAVDTLRRHRDVRARRANTVEIRN
ncbi:MAG: hypothetical protein ACI4X9_06300, partial [Kiritimatiellia bacterium]